MGSHGMPEGSPWNPRGPHGPGPHGSMGPWDHGPFGSIGFKDPGLKDLGPTAHGPWLCIWRYTWR